MLHVVGAGFPRTGTSSLKAALDLLGFGPTYHMFELMAHPEWVGRWAAALDGGPVDWDGVLDGYRSAVDWPAAFFWRELAAAYPDARVVLTVRDPRRWYASMRDTIFKSTVQGFPPEAHEHLRTVNEMRPALLDPMWQRTFGTGTEAVPGEDQAVEAFERHVREVRETVPADRLLVYELGRGWEPLCGFLGVPVPDGVPFPHLNDGDSMRQMIGRAMRGEPMTTPFEDQPRR